MVFNCRGRFEGHTDKHAGNYYHHIYYHRKDFERPSLIRQSLASLHRVVTSHAPWIRRHVGIATNWTSFALANEIPGCEEELHLPIDTDMIPSTFEYLCTFRVGPGRIGVLLLGECTKNPEIVQAPFTTELK